MPRTPSIPKPIRRLPSGRIPQSVIRKYVNQIVEKFHPQKVILFGSYAFGKPNADSDVDLLVVMPTKDELTKSIEVGQAFWPPFALDLVVCTPANLKKRLAWNDWFLKQIVEEGIVVYDANGKGVGA